MQIGLEGRAESTVTLTGGGAEAELIDRGAAVVLWASGLQGSTRSVAGEKHKGSERSMVPRRRAIPTAGRVTCDGAPVKFRRRRGPRSGQQAQERSWAWGGAAARLWESCGAAEQGALLRRSKVGVMLWCRGGDGVVRWVRRWVRRCQIKEAARVWACVSRKEGRRGLRA